MFHSSIFLARKCLVFLIEICQKGRWKHLQSRLFLLWQYSYMWKNRKKQGKLHSMRNTVKILGTHSVFIDVLFSVFLFRIFSLVYCHFKWKSSPQFLPHLRFSLSFLFLLSPPCPLAFCWHLPPLLLPALLPALIQTLTQQNLSMKTLQTLHNVNSNFILS